MRVSDDLEPLRGTYDWGAAFAQNPGEPVYKVTAEQRRRKHHLPLTDQANRPRAGFRQLVRVLYARFVAVSACMVLGLTGIAPHVTETAQGGTAIVHLHRRRVVHKHPSHIFLHRVGQELGMEAA
jgi:hypothetical protein